MGDDAELELEYGTSELRAVWSVACLCLVVFVAGEVALRVSDLGI